MADAQIRQLLLSRNEWWRDATAWRQNDPYLRELESSPFMYSPEPLADIRPPGLYVLTGPRRIGKSLEMRRTIARLLDEGVPARSIIYCSCDGFTKQDLRRLFAVGRVLTRTTSESRYWMIDEVTAVKDWSTVVKDLRDDTSVRHDCVVLSGSSARGFREATKNLAGRRGGVSNSDRFLLPMSFRDFCAATAVTDIPRFVPLLPRDLLGRAALAAYDELEVWAEELIGAWESYLLVGGFPRGVRDFVDHGDVQDDFLNDMWDIIRGDAIRATSLSDTEMLGFLARIGESITTPLNATAVARDTGLGNNHRVNDRINDLCFAFLAWRVYQNDNGKPHQRAFRKVYFTDPLIARLAGHRNALYGRPDDAKMSEQQIGLALARAVEAQRPGSFLAADGVLYERTPSESEIDFVGLELEVGFESKYVDGNWKREAQTLEARFGRGIIMTRSVYDPAGPVLAVPAATVAWLLP